MPAPKIIAVAEGCMRSANIMNKLPYKRPFGCMPPPSIDLNRIWAKRRLGGIAFNSSSVVPRVEKTAAFNMAWQGNGHCMEMKPSHHLISLEEFIQQLIKLLMSCDCLESSCDLDGPYNIRAERSRSSHCHWHHHHGYYPRPHVTKFMMKGWQK